MKTRNIIVFAFSILVLVILTNNVNAHEWACLTYGDSIPHYTCYSDLCRLCLDDDGYSTAFGYCKNKPMCTPKTPVNDTDAPVLILNSPENNKIYNKTRILFEINTNEPSTIYYMINDGNEIWKKLARERMDYSKEITFRDGLKDIIIKVVDRHGNFNTTTRNFYVDTKKPKVNHPVIEGNGIVKVKFEEANPVSLLFKYGNNKTGYNSYEVNLSKCVSSSGRTNCDNFISLNELIQLFMDYDGQVVESWMELKDIAGNTGVSKKKDALIDFKEPIINNPDDLIKIEGKYVIFNISITELEFNGVYYAKNTTNSNLKWTKLCSSLKDGICYKKVSFSSGEHDILLKILDKTGNYIMNEYKISIE